MVNPRAPQQYTSHCTKLTQSASAAISIEKKSSSDSAIRGCTETVTPLHSAPTRYDRKTRPRTPFIRHATPMRRLFDTPRPVASQHPSIHQTTLTITPQPHAQATQHYPTVQHPPLHQNESPLFFTNRYHSRSPATTSLAHRAPQQPPHSLPLHTVLTIAFSPAPTPHYPLTPYAIHPETHPNPHEISRRT